MIVPTLKAIEIENHIAFEKMRSEFPTLISEQTFSNLFAWRGFHPVSLCILDAAILVVTENGNCLNVFGPPLGSISIGDAIALLENISGKTVAEIERIPEAKLGSTTPNGWRVEEDPCNSDYVYRRQDLANLEGRKFHAKRNLIAQCSTENNWAYEEMSASNVAEVSKMLDKWCAARNCEKNRGLCAEYTAIREMIRNYDRLNILGAVIRIDGNVEAFTMGEALNDNTAVVHFEKANPEFKGLYQLINSEFCKNALAEFEFINREQDLCIEGLRRAKRSYFPDHMVRKFTIRRPGYDSTNANREESRCID